MIHQIGAGLGLAATLWLADADAVSLAVAAPAPASRPAADAPVTTGPSAAVVVDDGGPELRVSGLFGKFEGPLYGGEASLATFTAPRDNSPLQLGIEAQIRHAQDADPEGTLRSASLTAVTGNLVLRRAHGEIRPYAGAGIGGEFYHYDSTFSDTTGTISGLVYQGFAGLAIELRRNVFLDLRVTISDRDYSETTRRFTGFSTRTETIYASSASVTGTVGLGFRF